jgi:hypothetical protein
MAIPIVIIHKHDSYYLPYCLVQATLSNLHSEIFLLGDPNNNHYSFVKHAHISDYFQSAKLFGKIYKHLSTNLHAFEVFCFQRWFVLRDFMKAHQFDSCVHIDSDLMLYADLTQEQSKFAHYDFTLTRGYSGHCSFFNRLEALEKFCDFMMSLYTDPDLFQILQDQYQQTIERQANGGVSDMFALEQYRLRYPETIGEMSTIIQNSVYDCNVKISDGFEMKNGMKHIVWIDDQPFGKHIESNQLIRFNSLHFQGSSKQYMKSYIRKIDFNLNISLYRSLFDGQVKKTGRYLNKLVRQGR